MTPTSVRNSIPPGGVFLAFVEKWAWYTPPRGYRIPLYNADFEFNSPSLRFGSSQLGTSSHTPLLVGEDCAGLSTTTWALHDMGVSTRLVLVASLRTPFGPSLKNAAGLLMGGSWCQTRWQRSTLMIHVQAHICMLQGSPARTNPCRAKGLP